jgi:dinuclear metal center YbgI/SA1388 family protein
MLLVRDILAWLDYYAPFRYTASWDHCGLQVGDPEAVVRRLLVALDPGSATLNEAEEHHCQCLVTHHPLMFHPVDAVRADQFPGNLVIRAVLKGIHVISAHTNLDVAKGGTNDYLGRMLSLREVQPLERDATHEGEEHYAGMGLVGCFPQAMSLKEAVVKAQAVLGGIAVRAVGSAETQVHRVALCSGSGGSLMEQAISAGSDLFITGDIKYHDAQRALEAKMALIDIGHFASERIVVPPLAAFLRARAVSQNKTLEVLEAGVERDPFWHPSVDAHY